MMLCDLANDASINKPNYIRLNDKFEPLLGGIKCNDYDLSLIRQSNTSCFVHQLTILRLHLAAQLFGQRNYHHN